MTTQEPPDPYNRDPRLKDFRNFLCLTWRTVLGRDPTPLQYDFGHFLQHGPDRVIGEAFRGFGKSWITAAFGMWNLYWDPAFNVLIVSASKSPADDTATFMLQMIDLMSELAFLSPDGRERHSKINFDVGPAPPSKQSSVKSVGITGQLTGSRADLILSDDVETFNNSLTQAGRERIAEAIKEYDAIVKPGGRVVVLGTPQTEQTIYEILVGRGYTKRIWPVEYPDARLLRVQGHELAPIIKNAVIADPTLEGKPTEPTRFGEMELEVRKASYGRAGYAMQFKLDSSLADADRYPLKLRDLIITSLNPELAPGKIIHSNLQQHIITDLPNVGFNGDRFYGPVLPAGVDWTAYQGTVMAIDPAGTGKDETAYAIVKHMHGMLFLMECKGLPGGYSDETMTTLATRAKIHKVNYIVPEANFGDGMFTKLLQVHLGRIYPCTVEEVKHNTNKERRILDTLEPVISQHRLIVDRLVVEQDSIRSKDVGTDIAPAYQLFYQMTRLTRDKGSLRFDDRIDALAIAVAYWLEALGRDVDKSLAATKDKMMDEWLKDCYHDVFAKKGGKTLPNWNRTNTHARR